MLTKEDLLLEDEEFIGDYNVQIARWANDSWHSTMPPIYVIITDHRIIFQPHGRKRREPAIIPAACIMHVRPFEEQPHRGILLMLSTEQRIGMFVPSKHRDLMLNHVRAIAMPPPTKHRKYEIRLDPDALNRLISFVSQL